MRKFIFLITTISLLFCLLPFNKNKVFANSIENDFVYEDNQPNFIPYYPGGVTLTADLDSSRVNVVIPDTLGGKPITTIAVYAFQYKNLTSLNMSNNIKVISSGAFQNNQLSSVTLSNQLEFIGTNAFANNKLQSITIPSSVKEIWDNSFVGNDLETITLLGSDTEIKQNSIPAGTKIMGVIPSKAQDYANSNGFVFDGIGNKITYNGNGQTSGQVSEDYTGKNTPTFTVKNEGSLKKIGYKFIGWNTEQDGSGTDYSVNAVKTISGDLTLYAKWIVDQYEVAYNTNGGGTIPSQMVDYNTKASEPSVPTKLGYTFEGWYKEAALTNRWDFTNDVVNKPTTLYAKWQVVKYEVTFNTNGGSTISSQMVNDNTKASEPSVPTKLGYTFEGWYKEAALTNRWDFTNDVVNKPTTLYAKWQVVKYEVTFNTNGGSTISSQMVNDNTKASEPSVPTKLGYTFEGWYKEAALTYRWDFTNDVVNQPTTLYAKWQVVKYEVTFNTDGGSTISSQMVDYNTKASEPSVPTKLGYTFEGWYKEAALTNRWDFTNDVVNKPTTLYAKWQVVKYEVENNTNGGSTISSPQNSRVYFESNGGNPLGNLSIAYDTKLAELPIPVKNGFTFGGWYKEAALINLWNLATDRMTRDTTLYAKWIANTTTEPEEPKKEQPIVTFTDIHDHWAKEMIGELAAQGIITGYSDGSFHPNEFIQRQHVALLFYRAFALEPTRQVATFLDVDPNHSYYEAIMALQQAGIVDGSSGKFNPTAFLTRAEMAKIVALALKLEPGGASTFQDVPTAHWSHGYIAALAENGIVLGGNGKFRPDETVTRAEIVAMLYRALNLK
ncbi:InlB B-repeat-containing protein [Paenibacillus segetis]|uniref:SLH domain-containing protein n=1 Tax=Paenibacillus segetis TaxID=1325360 RepID=A0ABQ1Y3M8_9BACL|nr:InlB B-repeat-containing protein [Paenibacillus segetis]GGH11435.1 hypothetical protein GCM10008013_03230 [Paenibacillus segetis]